MSIIGSHSLAIWSVHYVNMNWLVLFILQLLVAANLIEQLRQTLQLSNKSVIWLYLGDNRILLGTRAGIFRVRLTRIRYQSQLMTLLQFELIEEAEVKTCFRHRTIVVAVMIDAISDASSRALRGYLNHRNPAPGLQA